MRPFYLAFLLLAPAPAFAYLDPGTGSLLLYAIVGIATTAAFALRNLWYWARGRVSLAGAAAVSSRLPDVVFHSEGGKYWQVFKPALDALLAEGVECAYVSADPADPGLAYRASGLRGLRPGGEAATIAWMNAARAALVVSTTPHLDVYMLRRSRGVRRYAHLFHAPTDLCFYEKYAFDWYDCLLTVGPFQEKSVRELERRRGTAEKALLPTGCCYFDYMLDELGRAPAPGRGKEPVLLYAPAWGVRSSVLSHGAAIIDGLVDSGFRVLFRPHPQFYVSHKPIIAELERRFSGSSLVEIDRNRTGIASMSRSDAMVTDLSGVIFDYACLFGRPILLANAEASPAGQEGEDLPGPLWDVESALSLAAARLGPDPGEVGTLARAALSRGGDSALASRRFREEQFYNFGAAGAAAARNIISILGGAA
ncbi:MAG TPA: CDP-glycerol glycerophosphotransferase family protein [Spirochaetia bacterium]|nr:CDP-glycerol glycerophosphotransferase family protein [Spirochaetia bacterium]